MSLTSSQFVTGLSVGLCSLGLSVSVVSAMVVKGGTSNTASLSAPTGDQGWSHVGSIGNGTGVYLGNGWVLTASHVNRNTAYNLNGTDYAIDQTRTLSAASGDTGTPDMVMFHIANAPSMPWLSINQTAVTSGTNVTMIGTGNVAAGTETTYGSGLIGYDYGSRAKAWGENKVWRTYSQNIDNNLDLMTGNDGDSINDLFLSSSRTFTTHFNKNVYLGETSRTNEAQAGNHDSGSGVFVYQNGQWELAGLVISLLGYDYNNNHAIYSSTGSTDLLGGRPGDVTYAIDLSYYRDQIVAIVPEPASLALCAIGSAMLRGRSKTAVRFAQR